MLFNEIVFGPIHSRRLGVSLGINLLPTDSKLCNFNCIYCECGWNSQGLTPKRFHAREEIKIALENKLEKMKSEGLAPDSITFSGNGEPTMHPHFADIIDDTIELRNKFAPTAKVSVLSNATMIAKEKVFAALQKVDNAILKLDSAIDETAQLMNKPQFNYSVAEVIERLQKFDGKMILQTMFLRGNIDGKNIDNTTENEVSAWLEAVKKINPKEIMIYTIDRETPAKDLQKVSFDELDEIAERAQKLGYKVQVAKK